MTQEPLFGRPPPRPRTRIARAVDPRTSHEAAAEVTRSGRRDRQAAQCLDAVRTWPGRTSMELARLARLDRYVVARRLPELRDAGYVVSEAARKCEVTGRSAMTWRASR